MSEDMNLKLPAEIVERAVRDKISAAIAAQLGDPEEMIKKLVGAALSQKVDSSGKVNKSDYYNEHEFLELMMSNFIRDAAQEALKEFMNENKSKIKEAVKKEVAKSPSKMAKVFTDGIISSMESRFSSSIEINFNSKKDY